jgi:hypothetical protein
MAASAMLRYPEFFVPRESNLDYELEHIAALTLHQSARPSSPP